jgi:integrase
MLTTNRTASGDYYICRIYKPDGQRTMISFGPVEGQDPAEVHALFSRWLQLFQDNPHKTLEFDGPRDAVEGMTSSGGQTTMADLLNAYDLNAQATFAKTRTGSENPNYRRWSFAAKFIRDRYGDWPVRSFGPDELRTIQGQLRSYRYTRGKDETPRQMTRLSVNKTINEVHRMFSWAVGRRMIDVAQERSLRELRPLRRGDEGTQESKIRRPVLREELEAVVNVAHPTLGDMLRLMWLIPIRPNELCSMRPCDLHRDDPDVWLYVPVEHKTMGKDRARAIPLTRSVQSIIEPRMAQCEGAEDFIFSPRRAEAERRAKLFDDRQTPLSCGNRPGTNRRDKPTKQAGDRYRPDSFAQATRKACQRAEVEPFSPYDLRRTAATRVDAVLGRDAAKHLLGHTDVKTTNVYMLEENRRVIDAAKDFERYANT